MDVGIFFGEYVVPFFGNLGVFSYFALIPSDSNFTALADIYNNLEY